MLIRNYASRRGRAVSAVSLSGRIFSRCRAIPVAQRALSTRDLLGIMERLRRQLVGVAQALAGEKSHFCEQLDHTYRHFPVAEVLRKDGLCSDK